MRRALARTWHGRRRLRGGLGWSILLVLGLVAAVSLGVLWLGWNLLDGQLPPVNARGKRRLEISTALDLMKVGLAIVAGLGAAVSLTVSYRKQRGEEGKDYNDRYRAAAEQLGHEKAAVRLAGVHAMARLADDWVAQRATCLDVLSAYLRMPYVAPSESEPNATGEAEVRWTVIRQIRDHLRDDAFTSWRGYDWDFTGAVFDGEDFSGATFDGRIDMTGARFLGQVVKFEKAGFERANLILEQVSFSGGGGIDFSGSYFRKSVTMISGTHEEGVLRFDVADFIGGSFTFRGPMKGGCLSFAGTTIARTFMHFGNSVYEGGEVTFRKVKLKRGDIDFYDATFVGTKINFRQARVRGGTVDLNAAHCVSSEVDFFDCRLDAGSIFLQNASLHGGRVSLDHAGLKGGFVDCSSMDMKGGHLTLRTSRFEGAAINFSDAKLRRGEVDFGTAIFKGGRAAFARTHFAGANVRFHGAVFSGTDIDFRAVARWDMPPGGIDQDAQGVQWPVHADVNRGHSAETATTEETR